MKLNYLYLSALFLCSLIILFSCREDEIITKQTDEIPPIEEFTETGLKGQVFDLTGAPVQNINIDLLSNGISIANTQSNEFGFFKFTDVPLSEDGALIRFIGEGYFENYKFVYPEAGAMAWTSAQMVEKKLTRQFMATEATEVTFQNKAKVKFEANSIMTSTGQDYTGNVNLYAYWYNPEDGSFYEETPGDLRAENADGDVVQLASYGMLAVEIYNDSGEKLNIKSGSKAQITVPLSSDLDAAAPEEIPLWYFDEENGTWKEEGLATKQGDVYVGEVEHFSFWNCDVPFDYVTIKGKVGLDSQFLPRYKVTATTNTVLGSGVTYTNSAGCFEGKVPKGVPMIIRVISKDFCLTPVVIFEKEYTFEEDTDLGLLTVTFPVQKSFILNAQALDCQELPVPNAYLRFSAAGRSFVYESDANGSISENIIACDPIVGGEIQAFDLNTNKQSDISQVVFNANQESELVSLRVCDELEPFLDMSINGCATVEMPDPQIFRLDESSYLVYSYDYDNGSYIAMIIDAASSPSRILKGYYRIYRTDLGIQESVLCPAVVASGQEPVCDGLSVDKLEVNSLTNDVFGVVSGYLNDANGNENTLEVSFTLNIEEEKLSRVPVEVKVWLDLNENGIQDQGEPFPTESGWGYTATDLAASSRFRVEIFRTKGSYDKTTGILTYEVLSNDWVRLSTSNGFPITKMNEGSDRSIDNDFNPNTGDTNEIFIEPGVPYENLGLGLIDQSGMYCDIGPFNCIPAVLNASAGGGQGPYSFEWSNGSTSSVVFAQSTGFYTVTITDQNGESCSKEIEVVEKSTRLSGFVFIDETGGQDNVYDPGIDTRYEGADFHVRRAVNTQNVTSFSSDSEGNFEVTSLYPMAKEFILQMDNIAGYELVEPNASSDESIDSDLSSDCDNCATFLIDECDTEAVITVGLRKL